MKPHAIIIFTYTLIFLIITINFYHISMEKASANIKSIIANVSNQQLYYVHNKKCATIEKYKTAGCVMTEHFDIKRLNPIVDDLLSKADDGELFAESCFSESLVLEDGKITQANHDHNEGFGLRAVVEDKIGYAHSSVMTEKAVQEAASTVKAILSYGQNRHVDLHPQRTNQKLYRDDNPLALTPFPQKVIWLEAINQYVRARNPLVKQVICSLYAEHQSVDILRCDGWQVKDIRPLVRLSLRVVVEKDGRREAGNESLGGRTSFEDFTDPAIWQKAADEALRQALVNLEARPAPAGEMTVILGPGWPGVLLHEAVGHGLEGDFNRKKTSAFSDMIGQRVASPGVTVVDDGTLENRRGSLTLDDEGTPTGRTVLIEDGILCGYLQDRMNARLMGAKPTGNGRRQNFAYAPMPRMTNTFMLAGPHDPQEIIRSTPKGIYAVNFGGGQVDITSGKFVFSCTEAYLVENGKVTSPIKGATLIGHGPESMTRISMIGNDLQLDKGTGTCGKDGQSVPVGVGQPTLKLERMTVGGTETS